MARRKKVQRLDPEAARELLVAACARLLKTKGPQAVSVRAVAAEAGVNHGLVHRHFGSKQALLEAAVAQVSTDLHRAGPTGAMSASTFAYLRTHPEWARLAARACLDGPPELLAAAAPPPERLEEIAEPIRAALARAGLTAIDPYLVNGLASAALLGWFILQPLLRQGFALPADADDQLARLLEAVDGLVAQPRPAP